MSVRKTAAWPFHTIHDNLRSLSLVQYLLKGRNAPNWLKRAPTHMNLSGTKKASCLEVFKPCSFVSLIVIRQNNTLVTPKIPNFPIWNKKGSNKMIWVDRWYQSDLYSIYFRFIGLDVSLIITATIKNRKNINLEGYEKKIISCLWLWILALDSKVSSLLHIFCAACSSRVKSEIPQGLAKRFCS